MKCNKARLSGSTAHGEADRPDRAAAVVHHHHQRRARARQPAEPAQDAGDGQRVGLRALRAVPSLSRSRPPGREHSTAGSARSAMD